MAIVQLIELQAAIPKGSDPPIQNYTVFAGNTVDVEILVTDPNEQPVDLVGPGCTLQYHVRQSAGAPISGFPKTASLSIEPEGIGKCTLRILASETSSLSGTFIHLLVLTDPSVSPAAVTTVMTGNVTLKPGGV